ncbi:MAG: SIMPL domain-containing protein [archaeon]
MEKSIAITLIIVAGVLVLTTIGFLAFSEISPQNTISVNGESTLEVTPDLVTVYFTVETTAENSNDASDQNAEIVDDLIIAIMRLGFERKQIQTTSFNIYPIYNWERGTQELLGYRTTHNLKIEITLDKANLVGSVIDAGIDSGALVNYINFELTQEKQNQYKAQAIQLATADAKIKAESIAAGLGKSLGRIVSVSDSNFGYTPWLYFDAKMGAAPESEIRQAATDIQPGDQTIYANVRAVYKIA